MTKERAIEIIKTEWKCIDRNDGIHCDRKCENCDLVLDVGEIREAYNMAIKALSEESVSKAVVEQIQWERDIAIEQLKDLGYELGEKPREGDLISRTDLLNKIFQHAEGRDYDGVNLLNIPHIDIIENMQSAEKTAEWIPVSERLPEESLNSVIAWDAYRERCVFVQFIDGHFQITGKNESFDIQAWMPLPEPYKEEE